MVREGFFGPFPVARTLVAAALAEITCEGMREPGEEDGLWDRTRQTRAVVELRSTGRTGRTSASDHPAVSPPDSSPSTVRVHDLARLPLQTPPEMFMTSTD